MIKKNNYANPANSKNQKHCILNRRNWTETARNSHYTFTIRAEKAEKRFGALFSLSFDVEITSLSVFHWGRESVVTQK